MIVGTKQHDRGGDRPGRQALSHCCYQRKRPNSDGEPRKQCDLAVMANQNADDASVNRTANGARQIIDRRLQRPADAHLREDDRGEYRPERQTHIQPLGQRIGDEGRSHDPEEKPEPGLVAGKPRTRLRPQICDAHHGDLSESLGKPFRYAGGRVHDLMDILAINQRADKVDKYTSSEPTLLRLLSGLP